jgi:hypothetical protein
MFEGKEVEGKIGNIGSYELDVTDKGTVKLGAEVDIIAFLKEQAAKTATPVDDMAIAWIEKVLGR